MNSSMTEGYSKLSVPPTHSSLFGVVVNFHAVFGKRNRLAHRLLEVGAHKTILDPPLKILICSHGN